MNVGGFSFGWLAGNEAPALGNGCPFREGYGGACPLRSCKGFIDPTICCPAVHNLKDWLIIGLSFVILQQRAWHIRFALNRANLHSLIMASHMGRLRRLCAPFRCMALVITGHSICFSHPGFPGRPMHAPWDVYRPAGPL